MKHIRKTLMKWGICLSIGFAFVQVAAGQDIMAAVRGEECPRYEECPVYEECPRYEECPVYEDCPGCEDCLRYEDCAEGLHKREDCPYRDDGSEETAEQKQAGYGRRRGGAGRCQGNRRAENCCCRMQ